VPDRPRAQLPWSSDRAHDAIAPADDRPGALHDREMGRGSVLLGLLVAATACGVPQHVVTAGAEPDEHVRARTTMVAWQLRARDIRDRDVLQAMQAVPRHRFVPCPSATA